MPRLAYGARTTATLDAFLLEERLDITLPASTVNLEVGGGEKGRLLPSSRLPCGTKVWFNRKRQSSNILLTTLWPQPRCSSLACERGSRQMGHSLLPDEAEEAARMRRNSALMLAAGSETGARLTGRALMGSSWPMSLTPQRPVAGSKSFSLPITPLSWGCFTRPRSATHMPVLNSDTAVVSAAAGRDDAICLDACMHRWSSHGGMEDGSQQ